MRVFGLAKDSQNDTNATRNFKLQHFFKNATYNEKCNTPIFETKNAKKHRQLIEENCLCFILIKN